MNEIDPGAPATVLVFGEPIAKWTGPEVRVKVPSSKRKREADGTNTSTCLLPGGRCHRESPTDTFTVRVETRACGPVELCVGFPQDDGAPMPPKGEPLRGHLLERKREGMMTCTGETYRLWVDNRGGPAHTLTVGAGVPLPISANAATRIELPTPPCAAAAGVALDGVNIGALQLLDADTAHWKRNAGSDVVVDPDGARCYVAARIEYGTAGNDDPVSSRWQRERLHALPFVLDYFLEESPDSIQTPGGPGSRTEVTEVPCGSRDALLP